MTQDQHQQRIVDLIRWHAKEMWEKHVLTNDTGEWNTKEVVEGWLSTKKNRKLYWLFQSQYDKLDNITITHDTGHITFHPHHIFKILRQMELLADIPKSKRIVFGHCQNGNYCHYEPLCTATEEDHYVTPFPPKVKPQKFWSTISKENMQRIMRDADKYKTEQLKKQFLSRHFFFLFNLQQSA